MEKKRDRRAYQKEWYAKNKEKHSANTRKNHKNQKIEVLEHYGGKCACCGESQIDFLAIDHIDGGGNEHRRELGISNGTSFYSWLKRENFPPGFQVLCHNCNFSKHINDGECIHQILSKRLTMNTNLETIAVHAQGIIDATVNMPEQYAQKIEELAATILSVAAMAEGVHTQTVSTEDFVEGRNELGNGIVAHKENGTIRLERE